jgi:hypothetical protein
MGALLAMVMALLFTIPGCASKNYKKAASTNEAAFSIETNIDIGTLEEAQERQLSIEATLTDLPTMIGSVILRHTHQNLANDQQMIVFATICSADEIIAFYRIEMARMGWHQTAIIDADEKFLLFEKPKKIALVTVRSLENAHKSKFTHLVHLLVSPKNGADDQ